MWIFQLRNFFRNTFRLITIILIFLKHLIKNWFFHSWFRRIFDPKGKKLTTRPQRIRLIIEDLGPTFVKFGQILADRPDLASEQLRDELKKLQASARPFDNDTAIRIIEEELGDPIKKVFAQLDTKKPLASASIGQVYKGVLHTGEEVVVKVQRPAIKQKIKLDLVLMKILAQHAVKSYPELAHFNVVGFVEDFGNNMMKELDYTNEASNMKRFADMFKDDETCYIPMVASQYTSQKLLIMEYITGMRPDNPQALKDAGFDTQVIAENGTHIILKMILKHGFFHADPHPGNIFIRGDNQIVLLDHGMAATLKPKQIQALIDFMLGFAKKDSRKLTKALLALCDIGYFKHFEDLEFEISEVMKRYSFISYEQVDMSQVMSETFKNIIKYDLKVPANLFMLIKTIATIQKFGENLEANISLADMVKPYAIDKMKERFSWKTILNKITSSAEDYIYFIDKFPRDVKEVMSNLKRGVLKHEINLQEDSYTNKAMRQGINRLGFVFLLGLMLICSTLLMMYKGDKQIIRIFFYTTVIVSGLTAVRLFIKTKFS
ncbi:MAG: AarF/ABC1/UbiB kinase family protein [Chitinophagaceae bacterium]|jgi:ubiquinone biosynthesis protein|nr:AarF/ABC1/UbiB kinase family protein [Chitinophagaceae bacterium]MBK7680571.1 AarF/ABC1/UbiB kinase family protein [Chitinophagaceae bacterium]MBK8300629.1 AarF/ABC1/UbiB kinase family protein [Chitinophagaceae bacterium]MBK9465131.1 AarF/ABC1/UbiB kinase family protein [Chitinophagaceae bacterium]MBK9660926.1 AarF/ABC1/UbiB kinase family protein [Chitinophagaceae bacterium]